MEILPMSRNVKRSAFALPALLAGASYGQYAPGAPTKGAVAPAPYTLVRWNEDYTYLKNSPKTDFFDPIKYIPLGPDDWYVSLGGQYRYRYEYFNNFNFSPATGVAQDEDGYHLNRILLNADFHLGPNFRVFVQGKSSMEDGRDGGPRPVDADEADIQQLFLDGIVPLGGKDSVTLRFGRQDLLYGAQRLISPLDWVNTRRTFEVAKGSLVLGTQTMDLFWVLPLDIKQ